MILYILLFLEKPWIWCLLFYVPQYTYTDSINLPSILTLKLLRYILQVDSYQMLWYFGDTFWLTSSTFGGSSDNYPDTENLGWVFCVRSDDCHCLMHLSYHWLDIGLPMRNQFCHHIFFFWFFIFKLIMHFPLMLLVDFRKCFAQLYSLPQ